MSTPQQITPSLSLIQRSIQELEQCRSEAEENGAALIVEARAAGDQEAAAAIERETAEAVLIINMEIKEWAAHKVQTKEINDAVGWLRLTKTRWEEAAAESKRLKAHADAWLARYERMKEILHEAMSHCGITRIDSATNVLRIQVNGGKEALDVHDPFALPREYRTVTVTMPQATWDEILETANAEILAYLLLIEATPGIDTDRIREALKQRVKCRECHSEGVNNDGNTPSGHRCPRCEGSGTIPNSVPGARLVPRGEHLRIG